VSAGQSLQREDQRIPALISIRLRFIWVFVPKSATFRYDLEKMLPFYPESSLAITA
jgi:hypothetical protein